MKCSINLLQEVVEGHTSATVMALIIWIIFYFVDVSSCFTFVLLRISTKRTAKVVKIALDSFKLLESGRNKTDILYISEIHYSPSSWTTGCSWTSIRYNSALLPALTGINSVSGLNSSSRIAWLITIDPLGPEVLRWYVPIGTTRAPLLRFRWTMWYGNFHSRLTSSKVLSPERTRLWSTWWWWI